MAVAVFVGPQSFARAGEGGQWRPLTSIDTAFSPERKRRDRAGFRHVHIFFRRGKCDHKKMLDEWPQGENGSLLKNLRPAALIWLVVATGNKVNYAVPRGIRRTLVPSRCRGVAD